MTATVSAARAAAARAAKRMANRFGYKIESIGNPPLPLDFDEADKTLYESVKPWTLTGPERVIALRDAVRHIVRAKVDGAIAECGVWRGGSMLVVVKTLLAEGVTDRDLYLFDTFTEMPDPGEHDSDIFGQHMRDFIEAARANPKLANTPSSAVIALLTREGYPAERIHAVQGLVEETVPAQAPREIALLRLDTDWYESTKHELEHLYPRVSRGGIVIIDDYGHFVGAKRATDEYLESLGEPVLLHRIDFTGRLIVRD